MVLKNIDNKVLSVSLWRYLVNFWAIVMFSAVIADFFLSNTLHDFLGPISAIYIAVLAIYTAQKEFERWHDYHIGRHPGEAYVFLWTIMVILFFVLQFVYRDSYKMPSEIFTTYIVVIGVLAITRKSKSNYLSKKKK